MTIFSSDNVTGACPEVMDAIVAANDGIVESYGNDKWSLNLQKKLSEIFETDVVVFPVVSGTAANALALSVLSPAFGKIFCNELSHINTDECGAPEFFSGGAKLVTMTSEDGKINAKDLSQNIRGTGIVHLAQPADRYSGRPHQGNRAEEERTQGEEGGEETRTDAGCGEQSPEPVLQGPAATAHQANNQHGKEPHHERERPGFLVVTLTKKAG